MQNREKIRNGRSFTKAAIWLGMMLAGGLLWMGCSVLLGRCGLSAVALFDWLEVLQTILIFIVPAVLAAACWTERPVEWLHLNGGVGWQQALLIPLMMAVAIPGINLLSWLNQQLPLPDVLQAWEDLASKELEAVLVMPNAGMLLLNLLVMALLPALGEEICFRGMCLGLCNPSGKHTHAAIWVVAIIFSAIHLQFAGFIPRLLLGAVLGYLLCWSGSLWGSVLAHFTNNACVVIFYFVSQHSCLTEEQLDAFGTGSQWWIGVLSLLLAGGLLWAVRRYRKEAASPC